MKTVVNKPLIRKLKSDYISVSAPGEKNSFGGSQMWYGKSSRELNFAQKFKKDNRIRAYGCGLVAAADILMYLENRKKEDRDKNRIDRDSYSSRLWELEKKYFKIYHIFGITGTKLARKLNKIFKEKSMPYTAQWGTGEKDFLSCIEEMLDEDIPVLFSVGPGYGSKKRVKLYDAHVYNGETEFTEATTVKDHYMTVTAMVSDGSGEEKTMLELSSWGKKYYLDYEEYSEYVKESDNTLFSNVLYIRRK